MKRTTIFSITFIALFICITFVIQKQKKYEIVTFGDSITAGFSWQPYLQDFYDDEILNLGIGSTSISNNGNDDDKVFSIIDANGKAIVRSCNYSGYKLLSVVSKQTIKRLVKFDFLALSQRRIENTWFCSKERLSTIPKTAKLVFIMGGTNDVCSTKIEDIYLSLDTIVTHINNTCYNPEIILMPPIHNIYEYKDFETKCYDHIFYRSRIDSIRMAMNEFAIQKKIKFIDVEKCGIDSSNVSDCTIDGVHPNEKGGEILGKFIVSEIK